MKFKDILCKLVLLTLFIISNNVALARRGGPHSYELWGLPKGKEIEESIAIAIPLLLIGVLIIWLFRSKESKEGWSFSDSMGCLGLLAIGGGVIFLFPLLIWVEFIVNSIVGFAFLIIAVLFVIGVIYSFLKKK